MRDFYKNPAAGVVSRKKKSFSFCSTPLQFVDEDAFRFGKAIESLLRAVVQGGVPTYRPKKRSPIGKEVNKILKDEFKRARGEE